MVGSVNRSELSGRVKESLAMCLPLPESKSTKAKNWFDVNLTEIDNFLQAQVDSAFSFSLHVGGLDKAVFSRASAKATVDKMNRAVGAYEQLLAYYCAEFKGSGDIECDEIMVRELQARMMLARMCAETCEWYTSHHLASVTGALDPQTAPDEVQYEWLEQHLKVFGAKPSKKTIKRDPEEPGAAKSAERPTPIEFDARVDDPALQQLLHEKLESAQKKELEGNVHVDGFASHLTDLTMYEEVVSARRSYFDAASELRVVFDELQKSPLSDPAFVNAVRQDLTRVCAKVQTMRNLEGHETHRLKIRAPTEAAMRCPRRFVAGQSRVRSTRDGDRTDEEAIYRGADHWLPAGGRCRPAGQGALQEAWLQ